ncbi:MAG: tRNA pseudouridine synthase A [Planctomycetaceae bacterium]
MAPAADHPVGLSSEGPEPAGLASDCALAAFPERNIRLRVAYDGTGYFGWQVQAESPTLQEVFERGIRALTGQSVGVLSAGRTDSGVHALGQVVSVLVRTPIPPSQFGRALQPHLPPDVVVLDSCEVAPTFHATFAARWKTYRYVIDNSPVAMPFTQRRAWALRRPLDARAMHEAAQCLVGRHDFRCFETNWPNKATSVRTIHELRVFRTPLWGAWSPLPSAGAGTGIPRPAPTEESSASGTGPFVCLEVTADGFLYNMVRSITGTLVNVGRGRWTAADIERILHAQTRSLAGSTAPACGLYLVHVEYDTPWPGVPEATQG